LSGAPYKGHILFG
jgi:hypothetical protein